MEIDPSFITTAQWETIGVFITSLWFLFALAIVVSFDLLIGHALIPSFVESGHLPRSANRVRPLFYGVAILAGIAMIGLVIARIDLALVTLEIYGKRWI